MKKVNLSNVQEPTDNTRLPAGGYVCKITKVEDFPKKEYLYMEYDIAKGDFAGYYEALNERLGFWGGRFYKSYKETALGMFKRMCTAVSNSNNGFVFDGDTNADESTLVGKLIGLVLREEEYIGNDGNIKTRLIVDSEVSVDDIISGNFKVKELKKLPEEKRTTADTKDDSFMEIPKSSGDDLPF